MVNLTTRHALRLNWVSLTMFWELEEVEIYVRLSTESNDFEKQFTENAFSDNYGRLMVRFPLKHSPGVQGNSMIQQLKDLSI